MKIYYKIELEPVSFIAGDYQEFQYDITDTTTGKDVDLDADTVEVKMALYPYGDNETPVFVVNGEKTGHSSFVVKLKSEYTANLNSGLYVQQPIIIDSDGDVFRPCQGTVNIYPRAKEDNAINIY